MVFCNKKNPLLLHRLAASVERRNVRAGGWDPINIIKCANIEFYGGLMRERETTENVKCGLGSTTSLTESGGGMGREVMRGRMWQLFIQN